MDLSLGKTGILWILETNKGIDRLILIREKFNVLNFSILSEEFFQLLFGGIRRKVLNINMASLLSLLVSQHFFCLFHLLGFHLEG